MKKSRIWLASGLCLIALAVALGAIPLFQSWRSSHHTTKASPFTAVAHAAPAASAAKDTPVVQGKPVRIQLPSLHLDLAVIDGFYNKQAKTWTLTKDKAQYATITPQPNNKLGNTFLYGHNRKGVFATLHNIKPGDEVIITTDNGHTFVYRYRSSYETNPNDDSLFHYQGPPILTVQTCSGLWYQNRQLFVFDLVHAS